MDMVLNFDFEDSDFVNNEKRLKPITCYNAKYCYKNWFDNEKEISSADDKAEIYKFAADSSFYQGKYHEAVEKYNNCLEFLPNHHTPVWRDVQESLARCFIHLEDFQAAESITRQLLVKSEYKDLKRQCLALLLDVQKAKGDDIHAQIETLQSLIGLDGCYSPYWYNLYLLYKHHQELSPQCDYRIKALTCLVRARLLRRALHNLACDIVKEKNLQVLNQIEIDLKELNGNKEITDKIRAWMFEIKLDDAEDNDSSQTCGELVTGQQFEDKWFGWSKSLQVQQDT